MLISQTTLSNTREAGQREESICLVWHDGSKHHISGNIWETQHLSKCNKIPENTTFFSEKTKTQGQNLWYYLWLLQTEVQHMLCLGAGLYCFFQQEIQYATVMICKLLSAIWLSPKYLLSSALHSSSFVLCHELHIFFCHFKSKFSKSIE